MKHCARCSCPGADCRFRDHIDVCEPCWFALEMEYGALEMRIRHDLQRRSAVTPIAPPVVVIEDDGDWGDLLGDCERRVG